MQDHVLGYRGLADIDPQLEQLAVDTWCTPKWIVLRHLADQIPDLSPRPWTSRPTHPALPSPVVPEPLPVPADHSLRLNNVEGLAPVRPETAKQVPERAVAPAQARTAGVSLHDLDLVMEGGVLKDQSLAGLEPIQQ